MCMARDFSGEKELVTFFLLGLFEIVASRWGLLIINPIYIYRTDEIAIIDVLLNYHTEINILTLKLKFQMN